MVTRQKSNNNENLAAAVAGGICALAAGSVLAIPFYGFGPLVAVSVGAISLGVAARCLDEALKNNRPRDQQNKDW